MPIERERLAACTVCAVEFTSCRTRNGKWPRTCSTTCRAEAMRRLARVLMDRADELEAG